MKQSTLEERTKSALADADKVREAYSHSDHFSRSIIESSRDVIKMLSPEGVLLWISDTGQKLLCISDIGQVVGRPWVDFWLEPDRETVRRAIKDAAQGRSTTFIGHYRACDDTRWWEVTVSPMLDGNGGPHHLLAVSRDVTTRVKTREELEKALAQVTEQARLLDLSEDAIISRSIEGAILFWNAGAEKMYGWKRDEALGKNLHEFLKTKFPEPFSDISEKLFRAGQWRGELIHTRKDGSTLSVFCRKDLARDTHGKPVSVLESNTDITEQRLAKELVRESEARLSVVVDNLAEGLVLANDNGEIIYWNKAGRQIHEFSTDQAPPFAACQTMFQLRTIQGELVPLDQWPLARLLRGERISRYELRLSRRGEPWEKILSYSGNFLQTVTGQRIAALSFVDVTDLRRAEAELREREAVIRTVAHEARVGLVMVDKDRRYIFANHTYVHMQGLRDENIVGKLAPEVLGPLWKQVEPHMNRAFAGEHNSFELHVPNHPRTHDERIFEIVYEPRLTDPVNPYVVVVAVDVTERKQMQQTLEKAVAARTTELRDTNEQLEAFVYSIAHDLRAPLRAMQGYSEIVLEDGARLPERSRNYLNRINNSAQLMDRMILDLLAFGQVARADIEMVPVPVNVAWQGAIYQASSQIEQSGATIEVISPLLTVCAHKATLTQVLANLLSNALKFVQPGQKPHIRFCCQDRGEVIRLWLEDNGIGIDPLYHERIFRVFERLEGAKYPGTGVGLAIVRKGVERMNGRFGLESALGKGTQFWIELPKP